MSDGAVSFIPQLPPYSYADAFLSLFIPILRIMGPDDLHFHNHLI
jgi:hypothetical protein